MPDREKTIRMLMQIGIALDMDGYHNDAQEIRNAIRMLKEQEPVEPIRINTNYEQSWKCGGCGGLVNTHFKYCPYCGRSLKWGNEIPGI